MSWRLGDFNFGNIFLNLNKAFPMFPPAMTNVTEVMTSINPINMRVVITSWNTTMPKNTAVTGSNTPSMAVGVEPIYCIASVVQINDIMVGKMDSAITQNHRYHSSGDGVVSRPSIKALAAKIIHPTVKTYMVTLIVAIFFILDLLTMMI